MSEPSGATASPRRIGAYLRHRLSVFREDLMIAAVILVVVFAFMLPSMIVTIPSGHLGVKWQRFGGGTVLNSPVREGTALIWPWDHIFIYDARLQSAERELEVLSSDGLKLTIDLAWRYRVIPNVLGELHQYVGPDYAETLVAPSVGARARDVIGIYRPEDIYTERRLQIQNHVTTSVRYDLAHRVGSSTRKEWVVLEDVLIKRIDLPDALEDSIVRKNMARHEVEQYALIVEKELKETERKRIEALGIRNFQEIVSNGMSDNYLRWRGIEATLELARSNNAKVVMVGNIGTGGLPLISISGESSPSQAPAPAAASKLRSDASGKADQSSARNIAVTTPGAAKAAAVKPANVRDKAGSRLTLKAEAAASPR